jgi:hypothetical protein
MLALVITHYFRTGLDWNLPRLWSKTPEIRALKRWKFSGKGWENRGLKWLIYPWKHLVAGKNLGCLNDSDRFNRSFFKWVGENPSETRKKNGLTSWTTAAQDRSMVDLHAIYCDHQNCGSEPSETWGLYKHNMWMVGIVAYLGEKNHKKLPSSRTNCRTCTLGGSSCKWFAVLCSKHPETYEQSNIFMYWIPKRKHAWIP